MGDYDDDTDDDANDDNDDGDANDDDCDDANYSFLKESVLVTPPCVAMASR